MSNYSIHVARPEQAKESWLLARSLQRSVAVDDNGENVPLTHPHVPYAVCSVQTSETEWVPRLLRM